MEVLKVSIKMFCVNVIYFVLHHCNEVYGIISFSDAELSRCISLSFQSNSRNLRMAQYESHGSSVSQVHAVVSSILYSLLRWYEHKCPARTSSSSILARPSTVRCYLSTYDALVSLKNNRVIVSNFNIYVFTSNTWKLKYC